MKGPFLFLFLFLSVLVNAQNRYEVSSAVEFNMAQGQASAGDTIAWLPGSYSNIRQEIDKDGLIVTARQYGTVVFSGASRVVINGDNITFSGFQFIGGVIGNLDVIRVYGKDVLVTQVNIQNYTCFKYLRVYQESRRTTISYCNFENRLNSDDQNILSILVGDEPGYHKIQHCSFKNFDGIGNDQGIEPIRIGVSSQGDLDSRTLVEYCYFTRCNGDGEIISHKSRQNVYRYNTFEDNPVAELVLRHGDEGIVYGNFFLNNMGGIRIREGSDHYVYNNYFEGLDRRSIYLQNDPSDPLSNIHIYHNTFINSEEVRLGSNGSNPPTDVVIANNVFGNPKEQLFDEDTGNETWLNNISFGNLGIDVPSTGIVDIDPKLSENTMGFFQPEVSSPLLASAIAGYPTIPLYPDMEYDNEILFDVMKEARPPLPADQAIGASEFSVTTNVQPHANELNTGPSYLFDNPVNYIAANASQLYVGNEIESRSIVISSNINWTVESSAEWISSDVQSGVGDGQIQISIDANQQDERRSGFLNVVADTQSVSIEIFQDAGELSSVQETNGSSLLVYPNPSSGKITLRNLPVKSSNSIIEITDIDGRSVFSQEYRFNDNEMIIDSDNLLPGIYLLNIKLMDQAGIIQGEIKRRILRI